MTMRNSNLTLDYIASVTSQSPLQKLADGNWRTAPVRVCFPQLHEPKVQGEDNDEKKYSAMFLFPPGADLSLLVQAVEACVLTEWPNLDQVGGPSRASLEMPWNDQALKQQFEPFTAGSWFINCKSGNMPFLSNTAGAPIPNVKEKFYPGCWVLALVRPYAWNFRNKQGQVIKRGMSIGLQGAIFLCDDNQLGGGGVDQQSAIAGLGALAGMGGIDSAVSPTALFAGASGAPPLSPPLYGTPALPAQPGAPPAPLAAAAATSAAGLSPAALSVGPSPAAPAPASVAPSSPPSAPQPYLDPATGQWVLPGQGGAAAPPAPPAPPPAAPTKQLLPHAQGAYADYIAAGWTDAQLVANGLMAAQ